MPESHSVTYWPLRPKTQSDEDLALDVSRMIELHLTDHRTPGTLGPDTGSKRPGVPLGFEESHVRRKVRITVEVSE